MQTKNQPVPVIHTSRFIVLLLIVSIIMLFAAFTSAYIVKKADGNWLTFTMPTLFYWSTVVIVLSSITLHAGFLFLKKGKFHLSTLSVFFTLLLGIAFLFTQWFAWVELVDGGIFFGGSSSNASGSFMYAISGLHGIHILAGLIYLIVQLFRSMKSSGNSNELLKYQNCAIFWHFLGLLWLYLYVFLTINR